MKSPRRLARLILGAVTTPFVVWVLIVTLLPTDCTRDRLVAILARETGRTVRIERIRLGFMGGVRLVNLEVGERDRPEDPWLRVAELNLDVNLFHILLGRVEPTEIAARGAMLRVERRPNGKFEFGDLLNARRSSANKPGASIRDAGDVPSPIVHFSVVDARLILIDDGTGTHLEVVNLQGRGTWQRFRTTLEELHGRLDRGRFEMVGQLDRGPGDPMFEGQVKLEHVVLGSSTAALGYVIPFLKGPAKNLDRRLDLNLYLRGHGSTTETLASTLVGQGTVFVSPIALDASSLFSELDKIGLVPAGKRVGSVSSTFSVSDQKVTTKDLTILVAHSPIVLSGWTDFTGRLDYRIRADTFSTKLGEDLRGVLAELPEEIDDLLLLRVQGTLDHLQLTMDGVPVEKGPSADPARLVKDKAKLREIGRRLRNRILR